MKDIIIKVNTETGFASCETNTIGNQNSNIQNKIKFELSQMIDGVAWLEYDNGCDKNYALMDKYENGYEILIKSVLLINPKLKVNLKITEDEVANGIPVFTSTIREFYIPRTLNTTEEEPEQYPSWFETASEIINEAETMDIDIETSSLGSEVVITRKDGTEKRATVSGGGTYDHSELNNLDYEHSGHTGFQPTINDLDTIRSGASLGANAVQDNNYVHTDNNYTTAEKNKLDRIDMSTKQDKLTSSNAGNNVTITEVDGVVKINSTGGGSGGVSDFDQLSNRPSYNGTPMTHSTNIPSVPSKVSDLNNDSGFIDKDVNNLSNYTTTNNLGDLALKDTVDYQTEVTNKPTIPSALSDLSDNSTHRTVTDIEKTTWNGKQDELTAGDNITIQNNVISATEQIYIGTGEMPEGYHIQIDPEGDVLNPETYLNNLFNDYMEENPPQPGHSPVITTSRNGKVVTILSDGIDIGSVRDGNDGEGSSADTSGLICPWYQGVDLTNKFSSEIEEFNDDPWAWIQSRITNKDFSGLNIGDYIPMTIYGYTFNMQIAGINTYLDYGDPWTGITGLSTVKNHIDFISKELWTYPHTINIGGYNNGRNTGNSVTSQIPWLCSDLYFWLNSLSGVVPSGTISSTDTTYTETTESVNYTQSGVYAYLPQAVKNVITEKAFFVERRYGSSIPNSAYSNSTSYRNIGKLWLPTELEVAGAYIWGGASAALSGSIYYPIFWGNNNRRKCISGSSTSAAWWLLTPAYNSTQYWSAVSYTSEMTNYRTDQKSENSGITGKNINVYVPICFRIQERTAN